MVFATGSPHARLMLVGEAPGYEEEQQQEPFVGPAGQKLTQILTAMGLSRSEVYISNICKFRPSMGPQQHTANRAPSDEEIAARKANAQPWPERNVTGWLRRYAKLVGNASSGASLA
jgi:DNA polymerase